MGFSRRKYWSGLPFPSPVIEPRSPASQADFLQFELQQVLLLSRFSCVRLCDRIDGSPSGSSVPGILQARTLEWGAISFSKACMHAKSLQSCLTLCDPMDSSPPGSSATEFSRQEYWSGLPFPSPKSRELLYLVGIFETPSPGDSISVALRKLLQGGRRGSQATYKFATKGTGSLNIEDYCQVRKISYQVKEFSVLCVGRCKPLGSQSSFLSCAPQLSGTRSCFFVPLKE